MDLFNLHLQTKQLHATSRALAVPAVGGFALEISSSNLNFRITAVEIDSLKPHEEVIDSVVKALAKEMRAEGEVKDPLMVDRDELLVLDGMHRHQALKFLGCRFAPCCLFDYDDPKIKVGSWFRLFKLNEPERVAEETLAASRISFSKRKIGEFKVDSDAVMFARSNVEFIARPGGDPVERARVAVELEKSIVGRGHQVDYLSENVALQLLKDGRVDLVIPVPIFRKQDIRDFGIQNRLLPHKVTRHIIPSRPLHVNIPLSMLGQNTAKPAEVERVVGQLLAKRKVERKMPGSVVDGRRYEEELLVFAS